MKVNLQPKTEPRWRGALGIVLLLSAFIPAVHAADNLPVTTPGTSLDQLAMMDGMGAMMGGMMGAMPPDKPMPGADAPGGMGGMGGMAPRSGLPGYPGASHLYHVGSTGFFLDHPQHITLSTEQQTALNRIKETAVLDRANSQRRIEDAEQELWTLTAADSPDAAKIESAIRAIEKLRGDQRMAFIRAVGEASKILTPDQRAALLGTKPPAGAKPTPMKDK